MPVVPEMPDWVSALLVAIVAASSGWIGWLSRTRRNRAEERLEHEKQESIGANKLIDQLQEELRSYREESSRRQTAQDERMNRLDHLATAYRSHVYELRSHIWDGKPPPPPKWPDDLPR